MTEPGSGLRFDIYERVHLPEGLDGIEELEEAELVPHIQVVEEDDYAVIKGNLWLTGAYRGDSGSTGQPLEHLIPVEITMPQNRISRLEDVRVEIDQFDVELLTDRSLNVTGVLSLHGLEMLSNADGAEERGSDEETVFAYDIPAAEEPADEEVRAEEPKAAKEKVKEKAKENELDPALEGVTLDPGILEWSEEEMDSLAPLAVSPEKQTEPNAASALEDKAAKGGGGFFSFTGLFGESEPEQETEAAEEKAVPAFAESAAEYEPEPVDRQELKVAISAKPSELSPLHNLVRPPAKVPVEETARENDVSAAEAVEWKNLFIRESEANAFKRMRICIVQKEETIEEIADRYKLSARELAFYNQLGGQQVAEGQVLIIPS